MTRSYNETGAMTTRTCQGCGAHIAASSLMDCPKCGARLPSVGEAAVQTPPAYSPAMINAVGVFALVVIGFIVYLFLNRERPTEGIQEALLLCQKAVAFVSRDPDKANVPYVAPVITAEEFRFSWGHGTTHLRLRNGLGLEVAATGKCSVSRATGSVTRLAVDGQEFPVQ